MNKKITKLTKKLVDRMPADKDMKDGVFYYAAIEDIITAIHKCCCGCGEQQVTNIITPAMPDGWIMYDCLDDKLKHDPELFTLDPSLKLRGCPNKSHYSIIENRVVWHE